MRVSEDSRCTGLDWYSVLRKIGEIERGRGQWTSQPKECHL